MIDIDYTSDNFIMKSVSKEEIPYIQEWFNYNLTDNYNMISPIGIREFYESFFASYICKEEYYVKIYDKYKKAFIGIVKGHIENKSLYIYLLMIDKEERRKGNGTKIIREVSEYFKERYLIEDVCTGVMADIESLKVFLEKLGFEQYRRINKYFETNGQRYDGVLFRNIL